MNDPELADLQGALLRALTGARSTDEVLQRLAREPLSEEAKAWVASFDPRALEVALAIVQRWVIVEGADEPE
ncbi:MAG: hypothetical protein U0271_45405 [Polyangiaceae bacterium]